MKTLIALFTVLSINSAFATMNWDFKSTTACEDAKAMNIQVVTDMFCDATKEFSQDAFCEQTSCLLNKHISHCDEVLQESANRLGYTFSQESEESLMLGAGIVRYCIGSLL